MDTSVLGSGHVFSCEPNEEPARSFFSREGCLDYMALLWFCDLHRGKPVQIDDSVEVHQYDVENKDDSNSKKPVRRVVCANDRGSCSIIKILRQHEGWDIPKLDQTFEDKKHSQADPEDKKPSTSTSAFSRKQSATSMIAALSIDGENQKRVYGPLRATARPEVIPPATPLASLLTPGFYRLGDTVIQGPLTVIKRPCLRRGVHAILQAMGQMPGSQDVSKFLDKIDDNPEFLCVENASTFYSRLFPGSGSGYIVQARLLLLHSMVNAHSEIGEAEALPKDMILEHLRDVTRHSALVLLINAHNSGTIQLDRRRFSPCASEVGMTMFHSI